VNEEGVERRLTTILAADVVGYSRLMAADEAGTLAQLKSHRTELVERKTTKHHGRVVKLMGDGTLMEFGSVVDALNFAVDLQRTMADRNVDVPEDQKIIYRIGINVGDIIVEDDDIYGNGVIVASRLEALAEPGGIYVSRTVFDHVKGKVEVGFEDLGAQQVKNIPDPVQTFKVLLNSPVAEHAIATDLNIKQRLRWPVAAVSLIVLVILSGVLLWQRPWEQQKPEPPLTSNLEALDNFQRAERATKTGFRPQLREALRLFEKAMALDPTFARAFAADAWLAAYVMRNNYDDVLPGPVARKRAYEHASKALQIDPAASLPFSVLAILQVVDGRYEEALGSAERAVLLGPNEAEAHTALSFVLTFSGRHADAVTAIETAIKFNKSLPVGDSILAGLTFLLNDQPERAIAMLESARVKAPGVDDTHVMLAAAYALAGRSDAARSAAAEAVRLSPNVCVELYRVTLAHFNSDKDLARILSALRASGLPEWPYRFTAGSRDRLTADEIKNLAFGHTWQGRIEGGGSALMQMKPNGDLVFRTISRIATGKARISSDTLCERIEGSSLGRSACGPVYRRAISSGENELAYTYVNASKVFHFSPVE
jgi:adenylate cyclase